MDFITIAGIALAGAWIGWWARGATLLTRMSSDPDYFISLLKEIKKINEQQDKEQVVEKEGTQLEIEKHGDMLYAFIKETDQFVAQGSTLDCIMAEAAKRFPNRKFSVK